jgi:prepilin-type processing-associated H-X9-DG protein
MGVPNLHAHESCSQNGDGPGPLTGDANGPVVLDYARQTNVRRVARRITVCVAVLLLVLVGSYELFRPRLCRDRPPRALCAMNLRAIGQGLHIYAGDNGVFPPQLGRLVETGSLSWDQFQCPECGRSQPRQSDYRYVTGLTEDDPSNWIVAFDEPGNHPNGGGYILYVDGHVAYHRAKEFADELDRFKREFETSRGHPPTILAHELLPPNKPSEPQHQQEIH